MEFLNFKKAVAAQFGQMQKSPLFRVNVDKDKLWETYLASFPEGTNPMFRERTEYDCGCCRQFVKAVGDVVSIQGGKLVSIWDIGSRSLHGADKAFLAVANGLSAFVKSHPIDNFFLTTEKTAGTDRNFEQILDKTQTWNHFFVNIPAACVIHKNNIGPTLAHLRSTHDVMLRGLREIKADDINTVLELIDQNSIYRGSEHKFVLTEFLKLKAVFDKIKTEQEQDYFVWFGVKTVPEAVARIRNSAIGTLLQDLSKGEALEDAVKMFESKVAPENYKRPTALVTAKMIAQAKETVEGLGLTSALERRYAKLSDITINNVLFADNQAKKVMAGVFDDMIAEDESKVKEKTLDKVEEVHIDKFLADILPKATSLEVMMANSHLANLVSLIAPVDPTAPGMFKWPNGFSWSYNGDIADSSLRRAVQERGGSVDGVFRFTHSWNHEKRNASLMDLHVFMPGNETQPVNDVHANYGNAERVGWNSRHHPASGGRQDVDYTQEAPAGYIPVENITFPTLHRMPEGRYICKIHNWQYRAPTQGGFRAEIEFGGQIFQYEYDKVLKHHEWVTVAEVFLKNGQFTINHHLQPANSISREAWNVKTLHWQRVSAVMLSPNHWDGHGIGNKHFFFMLDGCRNEGKARGFFNEFLKAELDQHRKVLEIVGSKMKTDEADDQLSGLGFSSTQRNELLVRVKGSFTRVLKVTF